MSKCFNLLKRHCPGCKKEVPWQQRRLLIEKQAITCQHCKALLAINPRDKVINYSLFSIFCATYLYFFDVSPFSFSSMMTIMVFIEICRLFHVLFSFVRVGHRLNSHACK